MVVPGGPAGCGQRSSSTRGGLGSTRLRVRARRPTGRPGGRHCEQCLGKGSRPAAWPREVPGRPPKKAFNAAGLARILASRGPAARPAATRALPGEITGNPGSSGLPAITHRARPWHRPARHHPPGSATSRNQNQARHPAPPGPPHHQHRSRQAACKPSKCRNTLRVTLRRWTTIILRWEHRELR
jgi:hypothetical protein